MRKEKVKKIKTTPAPEKAKRFPKFGVLDVAIILLIIAIIIGLAFKYNFFNAFVKFQNLDDHVVSFSVENIQNDTQLFISNGDAVYFKDTGKAFGTITESSDDSNMPLRTSPSTHTFFENGDSIVITYPQNTRIDATGRIKCNGKTKDDGTFLLNGTSYLSAGQSYVICTEKVTLEITIISIEPVEKS